MSTMASLIITPLIRRLCQRFQLLDVPIDGRRVHSKAIPRLGGVALYLSCAIALMTLPLLDNLLTKSLNRTDLFLTFLPGSLVFLLGVYDDLRGTNAVVKFVALGMIASLFFSMGGRGCFVSAFCWFRTPAIDCLVCGHGLVAGRDCKCLQPN